MVSMDTLWRRGFLPLCDLELHFCCRSVTDVNGTAGGCEQGGRAGSHQLCWEEGTREGQRSRLSALRCSSMLMAAPAFPTFWGMLGRRSTRPSWAYRCVFQTVLGGAGPVGSESEWHGQRASCPHLSLAGSSPSSLSCLSCSILCWTDTFLHLSSSFSSLALVSDSPLCEN